MTRRSATIMKREPYTASASPSSSGFKQVLVFAGIVFEVGVLNQAILTACLGHCGSDRRALTAIAAVADQPHQAGMARGKFFDDSSEPSVEPSSTTMISRSRSSGSGAEALAPEACRYIPLRCREESK